MNPYGKEFTWAYINYKPLRKTFAVEFQWLMWQGAEFRVEFATHALAADALKKLRDVYAPDVPLPRQTRGHAITGEVMWDFNSTQTITPADVRAITGAEPVITYRSGKAREAFIQLGETNFGERD